MTDLSSLPPPPYAVADPGMPRWVKISGLVLVAAVVVFAAVHLAGGGLRDHSVRPTGAPPAEPVP